MTASSASKHASSIFSFYQLEKDFISFKDVISSFRNPQKSVMG